MLLFPPPYSPCQVRCSPESSNLMSFSYRTPHLQRMGLSGREVEPQLQVLPPTPQTPEPTYDLVPQALLLGALIWSLIHHKADPIHQRHTPLHITQKKMAILGVSPGSSALVACNFVSGSLQSPLQQGGTPSAPHGERWPRWCCEYSHGPASVASASTCCRPRATTPHLKPV